MRTFLIACTQQFSATGFQDIAPIQPVDHQLDTPKFDFKLNHSSAAYFMVTAAVTMLAARRGRYSVRPWLNKQGYGGINFFKGYGKQKRRAFAIDYHPYARGPARLHYHYGKTNKEMKKHREFTRG